MSASDAPVREPGTRARSGNAMARTRAALLEAAGECLGRYGVRKTTMVDVAARSRVAKATLYNHFRTKDDLLVAYVEERVASLTRTAVATASAAGLLAALTEVAAALAADPVLRRAAAEEPALLAPLAVPGPSRGWQLARAGVADVLVAARTSSAAGSIDLVLRWVCSQLLWPVAQDASAEALVRGLETTRADEVVPLVDERAVPPVTVGWPQA
ncbi:MAG TPA: TetR/AcrR family transcriptional regulator [Mycobacteriales bacterium]|nr:TetR/AcrR family transcriptional regulator [Mycobacteriales bacterium]